MGYCDAATEPHERKAMFREIRKGNLAGIVNISTLTTGVDEDIRCIVLAAPTKSEMRFAQMIGRGLRAAFGKHDCLILDHADNHTRLGFVTDIHHEKLLDGSDRNPTRQEKGEPMPKECKACGYLRAPGVHTCPSCGFTPVPQNKVIAGEGVLVQMTKAPPKKKVYTKAEKQLFWSMALWVDAEKGRGKSYAHALYRGKFGCWRQGLVDCRAEPDEAFRSYVKSRNIAYAKAREAQA